MAGLYLAAAAQHFIFLFISQTNQRKITQFGACILYFWESLFLIWPLSPTQPSCHSLKGMKTMPIASPLLSMP